MKTKTTKKYSFSKKINLKLYSKDHDFETEDYGCYDCDSFKEAQDEVFGAIARRLVELNPPKVELKVETTWGAPNNATGNSIPQEITYEPIKEAVPPTPEAAQEMQRQAEELGA